jgi:hypothetical protein
MKPLRLAALAAALFLGACSSPTDSVRLDAGASFDDGPGMVGSGNGVGTGSGGGTGTTSDTGGTTTSSDSTGTQRGGSSLGSGN